MISSKAKAILLGFKIVICVSWILSNFYQLFDISVQSSFKFKQSSEIAIIIVKSISGNPKIFFALFNFSKLFSLSEITFYIPAIISRASVGCKLPEKGFLLFHVCFISEIHFSRNSSSLLNFLLIFLNSASYSNCLNLKHCKNQLNSASII